MAGILFYSIFDEIAPVVGEEGKIDMVTPKRNTFKDREEWKVLLEDMQKAKVFTYSAETDTITLPTSADVEGEE